MALIPGGASCVLLKEPEAVSRTAHKLMQIDEGVLLGGMLCRLETEQTTVMKHGKKDAGELANGIGCTQTDHYTNKLGDLVLTSRLQLKQLAAELVCPLPLRSQLQSMVSSRSS